MGRELSLRTQIYLSKWQREQIDELCRKEHISLAKFIREAIDVLIAQKTKMISLEDALEISSGLWKDRDDIFDGPSYVEEIRREVDRRLVEYGQR